MSAFRPAAVGFTDDDHPEKPTRPAVAHHPSLTVQDARVLLAGVGAEDWPAFTHENQAGVYVALKGNIPVGDFTRVLFALGDGWTLVPDPRPAAQQS